MPVFLFVRYNYLIIKCPLTEWKKFAFASGKEITEILSQYKSSQTWPDTHWHSFFINVWVEIHETREHSLSSFPSVSNWFLQPGQHMYYFAFAFENSLS